MAAVVWLVLAGTLGCGASTPLPENPGDEEEPPRVAVALRLEEAPPEERTPQTRITLITIRHEDQHKEETELGTYPGACTHERVPGEVVLRVRCWWAGQGAVVTVSRHEDELVAEHTLATEGSPAEGKADETEELTRIELPEDAVLDPIQ